MADCHPDRVHLARGLCGPCYRKRRVEEGYVNPKTGSRPADCHPDRPNFGGGLCNTCYRRKWRAEHPEENRAQQRKDKTLAYERDPDKHRRRQQAYRYGLTLDERDALFARAAGRCECCGRTPSQTLHIDHDHVTGKIRGLLCGDCNTTLARVHDEAWHLHALIAYLDRTGA